jgi:hypothetical protein
MNNSLFFLAPDGLYELQGATGNLEKLPGGSPDPGPCIMCNGPQLYVGVYDHRAHFRCVLCDFPSDYQLDEIKAVDIQEA